MPVPETLPAFIPMPALVSPSRARARARARNIARVLSDARHALTRARATVRARARARAREGDTSAGIGMDAGQSESFSKRNDIDINSCALFAVQLSYAYC